MKTKFYIAMALVAVLLAASCSSGSDSSPATIAAGAGGVTVTTTQSENATTTAAAAESVVGAQGLSSVLGEDEASEPAVTAASPTTTSGASSSSSTSATSSTSSTSAASSAPSEEPGTSESLSTSSSTTTTSAAPATTTTTTSSTTTTTTTTVVESPVVLQVQVLNGSGVAGAAGRMTDKLSEAGYVVLSPENAPQRYSSSAVYYQDGWKDRAAEILEAAEIEEIDAPTAMPQQFATEEAAVIVLLGTDTAPAVASEQAGLRPRQRNDVRLPLPDSVPRDRYVPGLAAVNLYTEQNESNPASAGQLADLASFMKEIGDCSKYQLGTPQPDRCQERLPLQRLYQAVEDLLEDLGFTPQNVCGAPAGYSFTDLLKPTREMDTEWRYYTGDAIFTTDRLIELHGGERINPEANLDFYIRQAVQTSHDALRISELAAETEAMQLILCRAFLAPSGEIPELANSLWYANLTPGIQPRESLLSQGTYHVKEISRNGNIASVVVCHPTLGVRYLLLHWRDGGYRAEIVTSDLVENTSGCQAVYEVETYIYDDTGGAEDTLRYSFGERVFSAADLSAFPRG